MFYTRLKFGMWIRHIQLALHSVRVKLWRLIHLFNPIAFRQTKQLGALGRNFLWDSSYIRFAFRFCHGLMGKICKLLAWFY